MSSSVGSAPPPRSRRRWRWLGRIAGMLLALVLAVAVLELCLRAFDLFGVNHGPNTLRYRTRSLDLTAVGPDGAFVDGTLFRHKPNTVTEFGSFRIAANSIGFRGPEIGRDKPPGTYRIVVLGDSVTLGWGVDDADTFCRRLEVDLNARADGRRYEVVNTGHLSYDSAQEAALFAGEAIHLAPDLVLLVFVTNDLEPTKDLVEALVTGSTAVAGVAEQTFGEWLLYQGQRLLPACTALITNLRARAGATAMTNDGAAGIRPDQLRNGDVGWERSKQALRQIRDLCAGRGIPFLVLDHTLPRLPVLAEFCAAEGIPLQDLRFNAAELAMPIYNSMIDTHANRLGNELLLEKLKRALRATKLLDV